MLNVYKITPKGEEAIKEEGKVDGDGILIFMSSIVDEGKTPVAWSAEELVLDVHLTFSTVQVILRHYIQQGFVTESEGTYEDLEKAFHRLYVDGYMKDESYERSEAFKTVLTDLFRRGLRR